MKPATVSLNFHGISVTPPIYRDWVRRRDKGICPWCDAPIGHAHGVSTTKHLAACEKRPQAQEATA